MIFSAGVWKLQPACLISRLRNNGKNSEKELASINKYSSLGTRKYFFSYMKVLLKMQDFSLVFFLMAVLSFRKC